MGRADQIRDSLERAFQPTQLEVLDESERHRHHAGYQEGGESHFRVKIAAPAFAPMSRVARERAVHKALGPDLMGRIHALALEIAV
ncbi:MULTISPECIES: BolA family protein [Rhodovulum]|uniref:BolA protein n=2 Tax=Rhodovulum TaxID=34008 RepID=A0A8E2VI89_9RHOB|nr:MULTISPECIES: BolA family protein [Rhodovulum]PTW47166.1 BolA protein [Rhodovulum kholense]RAP41479.1 BolA family transcriptional regulator [Rhodovulum viride]